MIKANESKTGINWVIIEFSDSVAIYQRRIQIKLNKSRSLIIFDDKLLKLIQHN